MKLIINKGSSETKREIIIKHNLHKDFAHWVIGFIEGNGSFFIRSNNTLGFEISQSTKDSQILYNIKKEFGFGKVYHNSTNNISRYVIPSIEEGYYKLAVILNENLLLKKRQENFKNWLNKLEIITNSQIIESINNNLTELSWNNPWLSGFIDAEGCFRINYDKTNNKYQIIFQITQDEIEILNKFKEILGSQYKGTIRKDRETYVLSFSGKKSRELLNNYLKRYPLKTKKAISWKKWIKCERIIGKLKITEKDKIKIERIRKTINN